MENLPVEISLDIFSRLPVESVLQCSLVCKTWQNLVTHPDFADLHCNVTVVGKVDLGLLFLTGSSRSRSSRKQLHYVEYDKDNESSYKKLSKMNHSPLHGASNMIGSCNGLICFSIFHSPVNGYDPVYVYNPVIRECVNLPVAGKKPQGQLVSGFGYHPSVNKYKVVRIYNPIGVDGQYVGRVEVHTIGSRCGWRTKADIMFPLGELRPSVGVSANGALHWMDKERNVYAFDLADEGFHLLPSPPCFQPSHCNERLQVFGGCLCVVHKMKDGSIDIWSIKSTMKSNTTYNMKEMQSWTWSREFSIARKDGSEDWFYEPIAVTKSGEVLLWTNNSIIFSYDPKVATFKELVDYNDTHFAFFDAIPYIKSFVSVRAMGERCDAIRNMALGSSPASTELKNFVTGKDLSLKAFRQRSRKRRRYNNSWIN